MTDKTTGNITTAELKEWLQEEAARGMSHQQACGSGAEHCSMYLAIHNAIVRMDQELEAGSGL